MSLYNNKINNKLIFSIKKYEDIEDNVQKEVYKFIRNLMIN